MIGFPYPGSITECGLVHSQRKPESKGQKKSSEKKREPEKPVLKN
jgi:hypothetical protein